MRLFALEVKRVLKTRMTWILILLALALSALMAYIPVTFEEVLITDETGQEIRLSGLDAIHYYQQYNHSLYGEVTEQKVVDAVVTWQNVLAEYNSEYGENVPGLVYYEKLRPRWIFCRGAFEILADRNTGFAPEIREMDTAKLSGYYDQMEDRLSSILTMENPEHPAAKMNALAKFSKVKRPYIYYYGAGKDSADYQTLLILLITLICVVITAPIFSSDYQTGADDIQRAAKHGMTRLAAVKIFSALLITLTVFALCCTVWLTLTIVLFGNQGMESSVQMLYSITNLMPWNMGELFRNVALYSALFFVCTITFTLLLSVLLRSNLAAMSVSLLSAVLPMIAYLAVPEKIEPWVQCFLPSGGIGTANSVLYALNDYVYLNIGELSIWNVDMLLIVTAVEILLFTTLAFFCYRRKRYS